MKLEPETPVRLSLRQLVGLSAFFVANTTAVVLYMDRRHAAAEHRIAIVEREQASLHAAMTTQNAKLEKLTDAINSLAVSVARIRM